MILGQADPAGGLRLAIGDRASAWERAGFATADGRLRVGGVGVRFDGDGGNRGITGWSIGEVDGLPALADIVATDAVDSQPNGVVDLDHLVVFTPDCDRTTAALEGLGLESRRVRTFEAGGTRNRQTFFWVGGTILELVGPDEATGDGPATFWGLAFTVDDLDATVAFLGDLVGVPQDAVQPGRRIATLRHRDCDMSVPVAFMTPHR